MTGDGSVILRGNLIALLSTILWASSFPVVDILLATWSAFPLAVARLAGAAGCLLLLSAARRRLPPWRAFHHPEILLLGVVGVGLPTLLMVLGQALSDPVTVAILATTIPLISALFGWLGRTERASAAVVVGICLAVAGGILASLGDRGGRAGMRGGEILVLASLIGWTWYSRRAVRRLLPHGDVETAALTYTVGAIVMAAVTMPVGLLGVISASIDLQPASLLLAAWMAMIAIGVSVPMWLTAARLLGVTIAAIHVNLVPFYVMLMALAAGGAIVRSQVAGAALVACGALVAQWRWQAGSGTGG